MTLRITRTRHLEEDAMKAPARIYRTTDGELVLDGDPRAAFLLCGPGAVVPVQWREKAAALFVDDAPVDEEPATETPEPATSDASGSATGSDAGDPGAGDGAPATEPEHKTPDEPPHKVAPQPGRYDPADHNVEDVLERLANVDDDERAAIIEAERAGKARVSIIGRK